MRFYPLALTIFSFVVPCSTMAAMPVTDLTPEEIQTQEWDTQCRAVLPFGQGDLEAALLTKLRKCINEKRNAQVITEKIEKERLRLRDRTEREISRRALVQTRIRGSVIRVQGALERRSDQGTALQLLRTRSSYQRVHQRLRDVQVPSATND